jgi:hypothetical protein
VSETDHTILMTHIFISEHELIKVPTSLVLIGKLDARFRESIFHVFRVVELNVVRCKGLRRGGLEMCRFLRMPQNSKPQPGPSSVFVQMDQLSWKWHKAVLSTSIIIQSALPSRQEALLTYCSDMFGYHLQCICNTSEYPCPAQGSIESGHF